MKKIFYMNTMHILYIPAPLNFITRFDRQRAFYASGADLYQFREF